MQKQDECAFPVVMCDVFDLCGDVQFVGLCVYC